MSNRNIFKKLITLALLAHGCRSAETKPASSAKHLYLDVHELGSGNVTAQAVAEAHAKDLAIEKKYGVDYMAYWVDEAAGKIYCLVEAPSIDAANRVHREAHGLVAKQVIEVTAGTLRPSAGR